MSQRKTKSIDPNADLLCDPLGECVVAIRDHSDATWCLRFSTSNAHYIRDESVTRIAATSTNIRVAVQNLCTRRMTTRDYLDLLQSHVAIAEYDRMIAMSPIEIQSRFCTEIGIRDIRAIIRKVFLHNAWGPNAAKMMVYAASDAITDITAEQEELLNAEKNLRHAIVNYRPYAPNIDHPTFRTYMIAKRVYELLLAETESPAPF